ncbi:MAG: hypothetical protein AB4368_11660 [Xenococcaceae cyanobacterium]
MPVVERSCLWLGFQSNRGSGDRSIHFVNWLIFLNQNYQAIFRQS